MISAFVVTDKKEKNKWKYKKKNSKEKQISLAQKRVAKKVIKFKFLVANRNVWLPIVD